MVWLGYARSAIATLPSFKKKTENETWPHQCMATSFQVPFRGKKKKKQIDCGVFAVDEFGCFCFCSIGGTCRSTDAVGEARHHDPGTERFGQNDVHPDADEGAHRHGQTAPRAAHEPQGFLSLSPVVKASKKYIKKTF